MGEPNRIRRFAWEPNVKSIRASVAKFPDPFLARADIEAVFGIQKHAAQRLMKTAGAETHAGALFVAKAALLRYLAALARSADYARDERRRQRVQAAITEAAHQWELKTTPTGITQAEFQRPQWNLPEGVTLAPGSLQIDFQDGAELMRRLALLAAWCGQNQERIAEL